MNMAESIGNEAISVVIEKLTEIVGNQSIKSDTPRTSNGIETTQTEDLADAGDTSTTRKGKVSSESGEKVVDILNSRRLSGTDLPSGTSQGKDRLNSVTKSHTGSSVATPRPAKAHIIVNLQSNLGQLNITSTKTLLDSLITLNTNLQTNDSEPSDDAAAGDTGKCTPAVGTSDQDIAPKIEEEMSCIDVQHPASDASSEQVFKCAKCEYRSSNKAYLKQHLELVHVAERPFKCPFCDYAGKRSHSLKEHLVVHSTHRPYMCMFCNASFRKKGHLTSHIKMHATVSVYSCTLCSNKYGDQKDLHSHLRGHNSKDVYACRQCEYATTDKNGINTHLHTHGSPDFFRCDVCDFNTPHIGLMKEHMATHENVTSASFHLDTCRSRLIILLKCSVCGFTTDNKVDLKSHMLEHVEPKTVQLGPAKTSVNIKESQKTNHDVTERGYNYKCSECQFTCMDAYPFITHMLAHKAKTHPTNIQSELELDSGPSFTLDRAMGEYRCMICGYTCEHQRTIKAHIWKHTGHQDIDYPMFQNGPLSVYDDVPIGRPVVVTPQKAVVMGIPDTQIIQPQHRQPKTCSQPAPQGSQLVPQGCRSEQQGSQSESQFSQSEPQVSQSEPQVSQSEPQVSQSKLQVTESKGSQCEPQVSQSEPQVSLSVPSGNEIEVHSSKTELQVTELDSQESQVDVQDSQLESQDSQLESQDSQLELQDSQLESQESQLESEDSHPQVVQTEVSDVVGASIEHAVDEQHKQNSQLRIITTKGMSESVVQSIQPMVPRAEPTVLQTKPLMPKVEAMEECRESKIEKIEPVVQHTETVVHCTKPMSEMIESTVQKLEPEGHKVEPVVHSTNSALLPETEAFAMTEASKEHPDGLCPAPMTSQMLTIKCDQANCDQPLSEEIEGATAGESLECTRKCSDRVMDDGICKVVVGNLDTVEIVIDSEEQDEFGGQVFYAVPLDGDEQGLYSMESNQLNSRRNTEESARPEGTTGKQDAVSVQNCSVTGASVVVEQLPQISIPCGSGSRSLVRALSKSAMMESLNDDVDREPAVKRQRTTIEVHGSRLMGTADEMITLLSLLKKGPNYNPACPPKLNSEELEQDAANEEVQGAPEKTGAKTGICSSLLAVIEQLRERSKSEAEGDDGSDTKHGARIPVASRKRLQKPPSIQEDISVEEHPNVEKMNGEEQHPQYRCKLCHYASPSPPLMKTHMKMHKEKQPFECSLCEYIADCSEDLQDHMLQHCKVRTYQCKACPSVFHYKSQLRAHMRAHEKGPFICAICQYKTTNPISYRNHVRSHCERCPVCGYETTDAKVLRLHVERHDADSRAADMENLMNHMLADLDEEFQCVHCDKSFRSEAQLNRHVAVHVQAPIYKCSECNYRNKNFEKMKIHAQNHVNMKCEFCDFLATSSRSLKSHMKRHTNDQRFVQQPLEQYKCNLCGYVCHHLPSLKSHMWRHATDQNYSYNSTNDVINAAIDYDTQLVASPDEAASSADPATASQASLVAFRCCQCGFESVDKAVLNSHMKAHMDVIKKTLEVKKCRNAGDSETDPAGAT